jgi:hypothetical protein
VSDFPANLAGNRRQGWGVPVPKILPEADYWNVNEVIKLEPDFIYSQACLGMSLGRNALSVTRLMMPICGFQRKSRCAAYARILPPTFEKKDWIPFTRYGYLAKNQGDGFQPIALITS